MVTGCSAQISPASYAAMAEVDQVVGNAEKLRPGALAGLAGADRVLVDDIMTLRETAGHLVDGIEGRTRAFLQIQQGCDHRCTFCIIPYGRGPSRSVPAGEVVRQARHLVEQGYAELVLTGVDLTSYGKDLPGQPTLGQLVRRLLRLVPELQRLRLSSIDPAEVDARSHRICSATEPRLMPHLHLSVQAGDDLILKRMKRRHRRADVVRSGRAPAPAAPGDRVRRRPDRGLSDRERGDVRATRCALIDEADLRLSARLPVLGARGHAGRAHAAGAEARAQGARGAAARRRRAPAARRARGAGRQARRSVLVEAQGRGHTETFAPFRFSGAAPPAGRVVAARRERGRGPGAAGAARGMSETRSAASSPASGGVPRSLPAGAEACRRP